MVPVAMAALMLTSCQLHIEGKHLEGRITHGVKTLQILLSVLTPLILHAQAYEHGAIWAFLVQHPACQAVGASP